MTTHRLLSYLMSFLAVSALTVEARAQTAGSCGGSGFGGHVGLAVRATDGSYHSVPEELLPHAFSEADCLCASDDIALQVKVTAPLPLGTAGTAEVWVGSGCDDFTVRARSTQTVCEKIAS